MFLLILPYYRYNCYTLFSTTRQFSWIDITFLPPLIGLPTKQWIFRQQAKKFFDSSIVQENRKKEKILLHFMQKKKQQLSLLLRCRRWVIFPGRRQPSIVTVNELNYCVRNGNRCTLVTINTYFWRFTPSKLNNPTRNAFFFEVT